MKRLLCAGLAGIALLAMAGCSCRAAAPSLSAAELADAIVANQTELPAMEQVAAGSSDLELWLTRYYLLPAGQVSDAAIRYAGGVQASEIAVLYFTDESACRAAGDTLAEYLQGRASVFAGYAPEQAALAENSIVVVNGTALALLICPDTDAAKAAFLAGLGSETGERGFPAESAAPPDGVGAEPAFSYDEQAILQAWGTGDDAALSDSDRQILDAARSVIEQEITETMTDYEKELAIHDWITGWAQFDSGVFGRSADRLTPGSDTPYGLLINRSAMCHGYSSTFQLFMDLLDIECVTVYGLPGSNGVGHSWNLVCLDGEWYGVDTAWDDPIGGSPTHRYFNVTSETLRGSGIHRWEEGTVPEATGTTCACPNEGGD